MTDPFAELGLPRRFELDDGALVAAKDRSAALSGGSAAYAAVADPRQRAETLLTLMDGPTKQQWQGLPSDFAGELAAAGSDAQKLTALKAQRLNNMLYLFRQLAGHDKGTVQMGRQRMVRAELNAVDQIDALLPH
jgi:hypothetical protein